MSAKRYAKALFDVAVAEKADLSQIDRDMAGAAEVVKEHGELLRAAARGKVPEATRNAVLSAIAAKLGLGPHATKLFVMLGNRSALDMVPAVAAAYHDRLLDHQNVVQADITSAVPLTPEKTKALADSLAKVTGKKVDVTVSVDPELLGGVVARIGSTVYDGSVRTQLKSLRQQLVQEK